MRTYLFDWDNTLLDTSIYKKFYNKLMDHLLTKFSRDQITIIAAEKGVRKHLEGQYDSGELAKALNEEPMYYHLLEQEAKNNNYIIKSRLEKVKQLKHQPCRIGIVTNSYKKTIQLFIRIYNLSNFFDFIFTGEDANTKKIDKIFWEKLIIQQNLTPSQTIVFGDDDEEDYKIPRLVGFNAIKIKRL